MNCEECELNEECSLDKDVCPFEQDFEPPEIPEPTEDEINDAADRQFNPN